MMRKQWLLLLPLALLALTAFACQRPPATTPSPSPPTPTPAARPGPTPPAPGAEALPVGPGPGPVLPMVTGAQQTGIWVTGVGKVTVVPDLAVLSLGVEARADSVETARRQAAEAMDRIMGVLRGQGIDPKDIATRFFRISPDYAWNDFKKRQEIVGYVVTNQVTVKVRDLDSLGLLIDRVAQAGGDLTQVQGIQFTVEDPQALQERARELAVRDALRKAQQFARLAGVRLGRLVYITETGAPVVPVFRVAETAVPTPAPPTPISPGEAEVQVTVQAVFAIE